MGVKLGLKGLGAQDRTPEDQRDIQEINAMVTDSIAPSDSLNFDTSQIYRFQSDVPIDKSFDDEMAQLSMEQYFGRLSEQLQDKREKDDAYFSIIDQLRTKTRSGRNVENDYTREIKTIASKVSPYYKKFRYSDKLTLTNADWNELAAQYAGMYEAYGEEYANQQLNQSIKDNVAKNQSVLEKGWYSLTGMGADAAGSMISTAGMLYGLGKAITGNYEYNPNLNGAENFLNTILDNEVTRYGGDVVRYGTILNLDEARELGIPQTEILNTAEQDQQFLSWNTPFEVVQQGGFTVASMLTGAGASKLSNLAFRGMKKGALSTASTMTRAKQTISALQKVENFNNRVIIPGLVGTVEGVVEGLETKRNLEENGYKEIYDAHSKAVEEATMKVLRDNYLEFKRSPEAMPEYYDKDGNLVDVNAVYKQVWDEMQPKLDASLANAEAMAAKAGVGNFLVNSAINGLINSTYKAGLHAENVQNALRKGKLTGWAMPKEGMKVTGTFGNATVKPSITKLGRTWLYVREPLGEFKEEYLQSVSNDFFTGFAESNIHGFLDYKYNGGVQRAIGESSAEDWAAAWTELTHSLVSKETLKAGVYGALSSAGGTVALSRRTNKLDENGNVVLKRNADGSVKLDRNGRPIAEKTLFGRGQSADGDKETRWEAFSRWVPWRSGLTANIRAVNERLDAQKVQAQALEDWLNNPENKDKFDGLVGSLSWMRAMEESAARGDEHNYKSSKLGKAVSDVFMLQKIEGSELYNSIMKQLVDVAYMERDSEQAQQYIQSVKDNVNTRDEEKSDDEIFNELKDNAKSMLDFMARVKEEGRKIEKLIGEVDDDVKESLVYGQLSMESWKEESKELNDALSGIEIKSSVEPSSNLTDKQKKIIAKYGSIEAARKERERLLDKRAEIKRDIRSILKREGKITPQEAVKLKILKSTQKQIESELSELKADKSEDVNTTLNEQEIMALNPIERAQLILRAKEKMYAKMHQTSDEQQAQSEETAESNSSITEAQRKVIDNLVAQGTAADRDFLDKIVDAGRVQHAIDKFQRQYSEILINPANLRSYASRVKQQAADELTKERTKQLGEIKDYTEFAAALNNVLEKAGRHEESIIRRALKDNENYKKYAEQEDTIERIVDTMSKSEKFKDLDGNTADLIMRTAVFLYDSGVDLNDNNAVWNAITAQNEDGYNNLVSYINQLNEGLDPAEQTRFTSLEEIYQTYKDIMGQVKIDKATQERHKEPIKSNPSTSQESPTPPPTPSAKQEKEKEKEKEKESDNRNAGLQSMQTPNGITISVGDKVEINFEGKKSGTVVGFDVYSDGKDLVVYKDKDGNERSWFLYNFDEGGDAKVTESSPKPTSRPGVFGRAATSAKEAEESLQKEREEETIPETPLEQAKKDEGKPLQPKPAAPKQQEGARSENPNSAIVKTLSIDQLRRENPESAVVQFYDRHHIRQFLTSGKMNGETDVFFITDPLLTKEVMQETDDYSNDNDLPLIAVVEDENGQYEINGKKYQPIGIIPSSRENISGSGRMAELRKNANTNEVSLVTIKGNPVRTKPEAGGIRAENVDNNVRENTDLQVLLSREMTPDEKEEFDGLNKNDRKKLQSYAREKKSFLARMFTGVDESTGKKKIFFRQPKSKDKKGEEANNINIFVKSIDKTVGRNSDKTLLDIIRAKSHILNVEVTQFNSRTRGIARKVKDFLDNFPTPEEAMQNPVTPERLKGFAESLQTNLSRYLYLTNSNTNEGWHYTIEYAPEEVSEANGEATFVLSVTDGNSTIELATFRKTSNSEEVAANIISNLVSENGEWRMIEDRPLARWQVDYGDVDAMHKGNTQAAINISELVDDGIFELPATSLSYANPTAILQAPFMEKDGQTVQRYPIETNSDNAANTSSTDDSQATTSSGAVVDSNSGTVISGTVESPTHHSAEWAKQKADEIVQGSEMFKLSDDERSYINTKTGRVHARVTSVISADENGSKFDDTSGWGLPSTSIGNSIDDLVRDFFDGALKEEYPNMTKKDVEIMRKELEGFVGTYLRPNNIHIVPRNVVASGTIEVTDSKGEKHSIEVAGTLDLLGYDDAGNFYIFDMKTVRDPSSLQGKKHKWSMQTSLYQKFLENTYGITVKQRFIIPIHVHYDSPTKVKYEKGEGNQLIADGKEYRGTMPALMKVMAVEYQEPKVNYDKLSEEERDMAQEISQIAKDGGTITGEEMKETPVKAEVAEPSTPKVDPVVGLPVGSINDITAGLFNDGINDDVLVENDGSINTPVPGKTKWSDMTDAQREVLQKAGYTEESWNSVDNTEEVQHAKDCNGV